MGPLGKVLFGLAGVAVAVVLFLVLRPDDPDETSATAPGTTTAQETTPEAETGTGTGEAPATTGEEPDEPEEPAGPRVIRLNVRSGEPEIERFDVERGANVVLVVRADVADHVHLHGYDIMGDVSPGQPARIEFRATIPGQFEVELEDRHQQIAQLTVQ
jgi:hypothetical protein